MIMNASWAPSYDVRVETKNQSVQLLYYGSVRNTTGEDWKDVKLFLSTASPSTSAAPPPLRTLRVRFPVPQYVYNRKCLPYSRVQILDESTGPFFITVGWFRIYHMHKIVFITCNIMLLHFVAICFWRICCQIRQEIFPRLACPWLTKATPSKEQRARERRTNCPLPASLWPCWPRKLVCCIDASALHFV